MILTYLLIWTNERLVLSLRSTNCLSTKSYRMSHSQFFLTSIILRVFEFQIMSVQSLCMTMEIFIFCQKIQGTVMNSNGWVKNESTVNVICQSGANTVWWTLMPVHMLWYIQTQYLVTLIKSFGPKLVWDWPNLDFGEKSRVEIMKCNICIRNIYCSSCLFSTRLHSQLLSGVYFRTSNSNGPSEFSGTKF